MLTPALLRGDVELGAAAALAAAVLPPAHAPPRHAVRVGDAAAAQQRHLVVVVRNGGGGRVGEDLAAARRGDGGMGGGAPAAAVPVDRCRGVCNDGLRGMKMGTLALAVPQPDIYYTSCIRENCVAPSPLQKVAPPFTFTNMSGQP